MKNPPLRPRTITAAQRRQIIQRVIVDGSTTAAVATSFGVSKRLVDVWVADFRRTGMASLRREPAATITAEMVQVTLSRPVQAIFRKISISLRRFFAMDPIAQPLPLRRSNKNGPR
jgi:transposase-like protein